MKTPNVKVVGTPRKCETVIPAKDHGNLTEITSGVLTRSQMKRLGSSDTIKLPEEIPMEANESPKKKRKSTPIKTPRKFDVKNASPSNSARRSLRLGASSSFGTSSRRKKRDDNHDLTNTIIEEEEEEDIGETSEMQDGSYSKVARNLKGNMSDEHDKLVKTISEVRINVEKCSNARNEDKATPNLGKEFIKRARRSASKILETGTCDSDKKLKQTKSLQGRKNIDKIRKNLSESGSSQKIKPSVQTRSRRSVSKKLEDEMSSDEDVQVTSSEGTKSIAKYPDSFDENKLSSDTSEEYNARSRKSISKKVKNSKTNKETDSKVKKTTDENSEILDSCKLSPPEDNKSAWKKTRNKTKERNSMSLSSATGINISDSENGSEKLNISRNKGKSKVLITEDHISVDPSEANKSSPMKTRDRIKLRKNTSLSPVKKRETSLIKTKIVDSESESEKLNTSENENKQEVLTTEDEMSPDSSEVSKSSPKKANDKNKSKNNKSLSPMKKGETSLVKSNVSDSESESEKLNTSRNKRKRQVLTTEDDMSIDSSEVSTLSPKKAKDKNKSKRNKSLSPMKKVETSLIKSNISNSESESEKLNTSRNESSQQVLTTEDDMLVDSSEDNKSSPKKAKDKNKSRKKKSLSPMKKVETSLIKSNVSDSESESEKLNTSRNENKQEVLTNEDEMSVDSSEDNKSSPNKAKDKNKSKRNKSLSPMKKVETSLIKSNVSDSESESEKLNTSRNESKQQVFTIEDEMSVDFLEVTKSSPKKAKDENKSRKNMPLSPMKKVETSFIEINISDSENEKLNTSVNETNQQVLTIEDHMSVDYSEVSKSSPKKVMDKTKSRKSISLSPMKKVEKGFIEINISDSESESKKLNISKNVNEQQIIAIEDHMSVDSSEAETIIFKNSGKSFFDSEKIDSTMTKDHSEENKKATDIIELTSRKSSISANEIIPCNSTVKEKILILKKVKMLSEKISSAEKSKDENQFHIDSLLAKAGISSSETATLSKPPKRTSVSPFKKQMKQELKSDSSDSDSDAESRKAIKESAQKRIIQNLSTSESDSKKFMRPIAKFYDKHSESESAPEEMSFSSGRQLEMDSLKNAVESINKDRQRRKERRKQRLEKYKQQKEEKLIRLKEKRASQEDASCSSSEESGYEEDAVAVTSGKNKKKQRPKLEKENMDDPLKGKIKKFNVSDEEGEAKDKKEKKRKYEQIEVTQNVSNLRELPADVLESLPDQIPIKVPKFDKEPSTIDKRKLDIIKPKKTDVDYIPLMNCRGTEFGVMPLQLHSKSMAADFKQRMLYGSHIKRAPVNAHLVYQQKMKSSGRDRFVR